MKTTLETAIKSLNVNRKTQLSRIRKLLPGQCFIPDHCSKCLVAKYLLAMTQLEYIDIYNGSWVNNDTTYHMYSVRVFGQDWEEYYLPPAVSKLVRDFDNKLLPSEFYCAE